MTSKVVWSSLHLGTLNDLDTDERDRDAEDPDALIRTYGGADAPLHQRIVDLATLGDRGQIVKFDHSDTHAPDTVSYDLGDGPTVARLDVGARVEGTITFADETTYTSDFAVIQDQRGEVFLLISDDDFTLASKAVQSLQITQVQSTTFDGAFQRTRDDLEFVCFGTGTLIDTPAGTRAVEALRPGDLVATRDNGPRPLRWVGSRTLTFGRAAHAQKPILLRAGSLGHGLPLRDLVVSPQHRILLGGGAVKRVTGRDEALAVAKALSGLPGVRQMRGKRGVTYHSLLFDQHQIVMAEGAPVESFHPGRYALSLLTRDQRREVLRAVPALRADPDAGYGAYARPLLSRRDAEALVRRKAARTPDDATFAAWDADRLAEALPLAC